MDMRNGRPDDDDDDHQGSDDGGYRGRGGFRGWRGRGFRGRGGLGYSSNSG